MTEDLIYHHSDGLEAQPRVRVAGGGLIGAL